MTIDIVELVLYVSDKLVNSGLALFLSLLGTGGNGVILYFASLVLAVLMTGLSSDLGLEGRAKGKHVSVDV